MTRRAHRSLLHDRHFTDPGLTMMRRAMLILWFMFAGFGAAAPAQAIEVKSADAKAVRVLIEAQLKAFAADDAPRAFSFATPELRQAIGSAERFMDMVRSVYPVVYRPASVSFLAPAWVDGRLTQALRLTDAQGSAWIALYHLQLQADESWRISGCELVQAEGRVA